MSLSGLQLPSRGPPHTELLDLDPLPLQALGKEQYMAQYRGRFTHFNPIQTQVRSCVSWWLAAVVMAVAAQGVWGVSKDLAKSYCSASLLPV